MLFRLQGNPVCTNSSQSNIVQFCGSQSTDSNTFQSSTNLSCSILSCPDDYECVATSVALVCAAPLWVGYRLKSPGISDFHPYQYRFEADLASGLKLNRYQISIDTISWEEGPRLRFYLKVFPSSNIFNESEIQRIRSDFRGWRIPENEVFGPYELLNFTLLGPYANGMSDFL